MGDNVFYFAITSAANTKRNDSMNDAQHTDNDIDIETANTILMTMPDQLFKNNNDGPYITHAIEDISTTHKHKMEAILNTYFRFYKTFRASDIHENFIQELLISHNEIYLLLIKIFETVKDGLSLSTEDRHEIQQLIDNIKEHNLFNFNSFTSLWTYNLIKSEQRDFINQQKDLQKEHKVIVDRFEDVYLKSGLSTYSKDFSDLCTSETRAKKWWLFILALWSGIFLFYFFTNIFTLQQISNLTFTKLIIYIPVTVLAFLILTWLGRRYAACREQEITYKHLTTILSTYKAFEEKLDDTNKGLLILETARVVTAIPKPLAKESPSIDYSKVVDILKIMNKKE